MSSKHLVDPELLPGLEMLPPFEFSDETLPIMRQQFAEMDLFQESENAAAGAIVRDEVFVPGPEGAPDVRVLTYTHRDKGAGRPAYLDIHGGGFIIGSADMGDAANRNLAAELGCVVVSVDYRLAPETRFPGNIEDCYAALKWLHAHAGEVGASSGRIAIGGGSAGGGLAAALGLLARDRGEVPIIHQHLIYPMIDDRDQGEGHDYVGEFGWTRGSNYFGWKSILGQEPGSEGVSPYAAAARAESLEGLPSTFIGVGALDLFLESNMEYARRLARAGVPVELHVYPGAYHGSSIVAEARSTQQLQRDQIEALRVVFGRAQGTG